MFNDNKVRENVDKLNKCNNGRIILIYSALFFFVATLVFIWFPLTGKTLIWGIDGWEQHYKSYVFYGECIRDIIKNIFINHEFNIPEWSFYIGEGSDILQTLHYYCIGDPFAFFSFLFPSQYCYIYYEIAILLRIYLAGIFFLKVCIYLNNTKIYALLTGTFIYIFSYWSLLNAARHPFFLTPMVMFPLLVLGVEKIIREKKIYIFIAAVFFSAVSNFYFFYMMVLVTVIYVAVRLLFVYKKNFKEMFKTFFRILLSSILGVMLASVIVLPMLNAFLDDSRMGVDNGIHFLYPFSYYTKLPGLFVAEGDTYWTCMGYAVTVLLAVITLFLDKKNKRILKVYFGLCFLFLLIPAFGQLFNGMSYMSNRWIWAFAFLNSYIVTVEFQNLCNISPAKQKIMSAVMIIYLAVCIVFSYSRNLKTIIPLTVGFIVCLLLSGGARKKLGDNFYKKYLHGLILGVTIFCIVLNAMFKYAPFCDGYTAECVSSEDITKLESDEITLLKEYTVNYKENGEFSDSDRYTGFGLSYNSNIIQGISASGFYWTLTNPLIDRSRVENGLVMESVLPHKYEGYDSRTVLTEISGNRYLIYNKNHIDNPMDKGEYETLPDRSGVNIIVPLGYEMVYEDDNYVLYENKYNLPMSYSYDNYISYSDWLELPLYDREQIMMDTVVLEDNAEVPSLSENVSYKSTADIIDYKLVLSDSGVVKADNSFVVTTPGSYVTFEFDKNTNAENYLMITNMDFKGVSTYQLYFGDEQFDPKDEYSMSDWDTKLSANERKKIFTDFLYWKVSTSKVKMTLEASNGVIKDFRYFTSSYNFYNGAKDFIVNIGQFDDEHNSVTLYFPKAGIYSFDEIKLVGQPMTDYEEQTKNLSRFTLDEMKFGTDTISGNVDLPKDMLLVLAIPYSKGWTAFVDGEETEINIANVQYMGLYLTEGSHDIYLKYNTPYLREGAIISLVGIFIFVFYIIMRSRSRYGMN
ncbi:MAG: YfhO family protein [Lachnospira sp.]